MIDLGMFASLAGNLPDGIDSDQAQLIVLGLLAVCALGIFLVIRTIQKATTRAILVLILLGAGAGLWVQRENLADCAGTCNCHLFGRDVRVTDPRISC